MKTVDFDLYVHITGTAEVEETPESPDDLLNAIFPDGWEGEVMGVSTSPQSLLKGYMKVHDDDKD